MFSRTGCSSEKVELRGLAPAELAQALDALAMADGKDRNAYVVDVLHSHVREELRKTSLRFRMLRGNPLFSEAEGGRSE